MGGDVSRGRHSWKPSSVLTLKVTRVRDDGGAGRFQLVERGRHVV